MTRHPLALAFVAIPILASSAAAAPAPEKASPRVESLLARMTVAEKVGQLNQRAGGRSKALNSLLTPEEKDRVRRGEVGSYLHVAGAATLRELQEVAVKESRLHIPLLFAGDILHGYRTLFPVSLGLAATWDPPVAQEMARVAAREASAAGLHWTFAPMVDVARDARWGRIVEGGGEDSYLGAVLAAAQVHGYQGTGLAGAHTLLACPKHFLAYGAAEGGRDYGSADLPERTVLETYLPPFEAAFQAGALSTMAAFNSVSGTPITASRHYLTTVLRERAGFRGLVVSDWGAVTELVNHGLAGSAADSARLALLAGTDMDMTSGSYVAELPRLVESGRVPRVVLDQAVRRVLMVKEALGLFDDPYRRGDPATEVGDVLPAEHRAAARRAAERSLVLLKNEGGVLPLSRDVKRLAVVGALADDPMTLLGSWRARGRPEDAVTLLAGIRKAVSPGTTVTFSPGYALPATADDVRLATEAVEAAGNADAVVLVLGETGDMSGEARSRASLALPGAQNALVDALTRAGRPLVVVLLNGRPLALEEVSRRGSAILEAWLPGVEGGPAVAAALFGDVNPGGKLPATFPRHEGQVPLTYDHLPTGRPADEDLSKDTSRYRDLPTTPLFPFGHGLSYTTFAYSDLELTEAPVLSGETVKLAFRVTNSGSRAGDEVAQVYIRDPVAQISRPVLQLAAFQRLALTPGASARVEVDVPVDSLGYLGEDLTWVVEPGRIQVFVGSSSADLRLRGGFDVGGKARTLPRRPFAERAVRVQPARP